MGREWYTVAEGLEFGIDWQPEVTNTQVKLTLIVYRWDEEDTDNYGGSFDETLSPDPSGAGSWDDISFGKGQGTRVIDTFATRTYNRTTSAQTVTFTMEWNAQTGTYSATSGFVTVGSGSHSWTYTIPALPTYTISYNKNGGSGSMSNGTKTYNVTYKIASCGFTAPQNKEFDRWNTNASGTGTNYYPDDNYTDNATLTLYAIWKDRGSYIDVKANNYFKKSQSTIAEYINSYHEGTFGFIDNGNGDDKAYPSPAKLALINQTSCYYALFEVPYYDSNQVEFLGYWTSRTFKNSGTQIYAPTNWLYNSTRAHVAKAVGDGTYFKSSDPGSDSDNNIRTWQDEQVTISDGYIIPTPSQTSVGSITLPKWNKSTGNTDTFWAIWANKNLTFILDPDNGTNNEAHIEHIGATGFETGKAKDYTFPSLADINNFNYTPKIGCYPNGSWYIHPEATRGNETPLIISPSTTIDFGKYILDTTFYAGWSPFIHALKISFDGDPSHKTNFMTIQGGEDIYEYHSYENSDLTSLVNTYQVQNNMQDATFYGLYTKPRGGYRVFEANGAPSNDGIYFINNVWAYRTESTDVNTEVLLYAHWVPDTNAKMNVSGSPNPGPNDWKYGYIYINKNANNPGQAPIWELVPEAIFLGSQD